MLDDSDLEFTAILTSESGGGCLGSIIGLIIVLVVWYFVDQNKTECAAMHCNRGTQLMNHKCLCVEEAK